MPSMSFQIRVSPGLRNVIERYSARVGKTMSGWIAACAEEALEYDFFGSVETRYVLTLLEEGKMRMLLSMDEDLVPEIDKEADRLHITRTAFLHLAIVTKVSSRALTRE